MDGPQYPSNGINPNSSTQNYPSPTAISPHQLQSPLPQTLPPLQSAANMQPAMYGSNSHTPRTPGTPNTPNSTHNMPPNYQPQTSQPGGNRGIYSMPQHQQSQYPPPPHQGGYSTPTGMMPQTTTASGQQAIAPAPAGRSAPPPLRPMPPGGIMAQQQPGVPSPYGQPSNIMQPQTVGLGDDTPTHVVGSQGRRGILPSAPGRPAAPAAGTGATKSTVIPVKDADGKFPCPHCTKTYLHAKHLKRHLLRHTGDRPYMCVLCRDTFSRSDILKRHFQKCSIRRGNPTGVSHLSHPQAHVKKNAQAQKAAGLGNEADLNQLNGLNSMAQDGMSHPFGMVPVQDGMNNMSHDQNQMSRSSSIGRLDNGNGPDRRAMAPNMSAPQPYGDNGVSGQHMPSYSMPPGQNGMPMYGGQQSNQQSGLDWSQMFQQGAHNPQNTFSSPPNLGQTQTVIKTEPDSTESRPTGVRHGETSPELYWGIPTDIHNPFHQLSEKILIFFSSSAQAVSPRIARLRFCLSPDNIKDFLDKYTHFHVHTPVLHAPTFNAVENYTGLIAAMCCIGACYSDRVESSEVREMMDYLWFAIEHDCKIMSFNDLSEPRHHPATRSETEHLEAGLLTGILTLWNGTLEQRERARKTIFPMLAIQVERLQLLSISRDSSLFSQLHQPGFDPNTYDPQGFDWEAWIEQERRVRLVLGIFLGDVAMGLYFNMDKRIDPFRLSLPLPCDDAAWDAKSPHDCLSALGLHGPDIALELNPHGTRRAGQPPLNWALETLLHSSTQIQPGSTNLYGKFVLVHGILALIRVSQLGGKTKHSEGASYNNWATSVNGSVREIDHQDLIAESTALDKFKYNWDVDMALQFPRVKAAAINPKRYGFSRDGIHFYWLAKYMLKYTTYADLQLPPDARFIQAIQLLRSVRIWVMTDGASRGEELGSIGEIDENFGTMDLTLDMTKLFTPLPQGMEDARTTPIKREPNTTSG